MENKSNNVLNRVLLLMNYDSSKTLTENSKVIESEFSQQLNEQKVKVKPNLNAAKNVRNATINKFKLQHQTNPKGLTPKQRNSFGQELLKNEVSVYANTKLPNGKYPNAQQQQAYADNLVKSGKIQGQIDVHAPSAAKTTATKGSQQTQSNKQSQNVTVNVSSPKTRGPKTKKSTKGNTKKLNGGNGPISGTKTISPTSSLGQKIINLAKGGMNWKSIVWTAAKWGVGIAAVWWLFFSGDDETTVVPDDIPTTPPTDSGSGSSGTYTKCDETLPVKQYCKNETIKKVQACLGLPEKYQTGNFGPITQKALEGKGQDGTTITTETIIAVCGSSGLPTTGSTATAGGTTATAGGTTTAGSTGYEDYTNDEIETSTDNTSVASSPATSTPSTTSSNTASVQQSKNSFIGPLDNDEVEQ